MYADNTLTPKEATRLCALGILAEGPVCYGALAGSVRHFISHVAGPSLDLMGTSVELLKYEGLVEALDGENMADDAEMAITEAGRAELRTLLVANLRTTSTEFNNLIVTLKFRFLHLLERDDRIAQTDLLVDVCENELTRFEQLRRHHRGESGHLTQWLDHTVAQLQSHLNWLEHFASGLRKER
jgi:hypothetical protein